MGYRVIDLGISDYIKAYELQRAYVEEVKSHLCNDIILITEHNPVFTIGRSAKSNNFLVEEGFIRSHGIDIVETDRGGDITFHGPGQLVIYPILDLSSHYRDIHRYLRELEEVTIRTIDEYGISAFRIKDRTGVWTDFGKISSIGIGISRWVTYHGISINANVGLGYFDMINPCGFKNIRVARMKDILGKKVDMDSLKTKFIKHFCDIFSCNTCDNLV